MNQSAMNASACNGSMGTLPSCAPLANPYVPYQEQNMKTYQATTGLVRGTIYPELDLPFIGMVNQKELNETSLHWIQALHFAIQELGLYLDTHPCDQEAAELFNQYVEQYEHAHQKYEDRHRTLHQMSAALDGNYRWTDGPWPWDYDANREG